MSLVRTIAREIDPRPFERTGPMTDQQRQSDRRRRTLAFSKARRIIRVLPEGPQKTYSAETVEKMTVLVEKIADLIEGDRLNGQ